MMSVNASETLLYFMFGFTCFAFVAMGLLILLGVIRRLWLD
jgi:hypothetical protein